MLFYTRMYGNHCMCEPRNKDCGTCIQLRASGDNARVWGLSVSCPRYSHMFWGNFTHTQCEKWWWFWGGEMRRKHHQQTLHSHSMWEMVVTLVILSTHVSHSYFASHHPRSVWWWILLLKSLTFTFTHCVYCNNNTIPYIAKWGVRSRPPQRLRLSVL